jgi:hypothetical protein
MMDIQQIINDAKETILKDGEHAPILFAENKEGDVSMFFFADLPDTTEGRQYALFGLGRKHGIEHPGNPVAHLYFISEAWTSVVLNGQKRKYKRCEDDPNRKECLMIVHLDMNTGKSTMDTVEMLRDGSGELVDLLRIRTADEAHDYLLPYFVAGTASAKMSDAELARKLTGQK